VLVERFRQGSADGQRGCVLVASASFWEGIDVPGESLQLLIIDKLPFPPPNDPMAQARGKALEAEGKSAFNKYFLPEAAVALKQGAGRLIRRESDHGVLVVCDSRLGAMGYGKRLLKALPPMQRLESQAQLEARLDQLTKIGTTA
jgi:ATP-dependent DNA helicase DinG